MKRLSAILLVLALAALLFAAANAAASPPARAQLRAYDCHPALDPPDRAVSVTAVMRPLAGTKWMQLKFDLLVTPDGSTAPEIARARGLGRWISPNIPTLGELSGDVWNLTKSVVALAAPDTYQLRVGFRWIGANNRVIGSAVRYSWRCHQRELRPDLLVQSIAVTPIQGQPNEDLYSVVIANAGAATTSPFNVLFAPGDGSTDQRTTVQSLGAGRTVPETFTGPLCTAGSPPSITADSDGVSHDLNPANNSLAAVCPAPTPSSSAAGAHVGGQASQGS